MVCNGRVEAGQVRPVAGLDEMGMRSPQARKDRRRSAEGGASAEGVRAAETLRGVGKLGVARSLTSLWRKMRWRNCSS